MYEHQMSNCFGMLDRFGMADRVTKLIFEYIWYDAFWFGLVWFTYDIEMMALGLVYLNHEFIQIC